MVDRSGSLSAANVANAADAAQMAVRQNNFNRTCCNMCHIKLGAAFLGVIEAIIAVSVLIGAVQQVLWKNQNSSVCAKNIFRDCLIYQFNHFNVTLIFDYVVIFMMILILFSVLCLFFGVASDTSCLILPHIVVQAIFILFSLGYFFLYAFSYFYGDLIVHNRNFMLQSMFERMWLAGLLLVLAALQSYLFSSVIRCSLYLAEIEDNRRRRESAFERCSERVRIAKENGLWRTTSWGGGFQQYKGQYDRPKKEVKNKGFHVQWNTDVEAGKSGSIKKDNLELARIESIETPPLSPIPEDEIKEPSPSKITHKLNRSSSRSEERRGSAASTGSHRVNRGVSETPSKKDQKQAPRSVKKTASEGTSRMEEDLRRMSSTKEHHHKEHLHRAESKDSPSMPKRYAKLKTSESSREPQKSTARRPSLKKNRSVDSGDQYDEVAVFYKEKHHRRRSSDHGHGGAHGRSKTSRSPEKKEIPIVKKVSITASSVPFC
uniref:MARVEL domain-containing protein n=1 Tax=Caenorhabditis tropicalis TaxID=1561998 RepID=A0A1I7V456_9PELO